MTFDEWYSTQKHQLSNEQVCRVIWDAALRNSDVRKRAEDVIRAFEMLGEAEGLAENHQAKRECEGTMLALKAALISNVRLTSSSKTAPDAE